MHSMRAARLHVPGGEFQIDEIPRPTPTGLDVLVELKATGVVPNLRNVMNNYGDRAYLTVPDLPAIYGLDAAGVVVETGHEVTGINAGDRVYINPGRSCGSCDDCRRGDAINCPAYTFQGYFGFGPGSREIYKRYPYGGFLLRAAEGRDPRRLVGVDQRRNGHLGGGRGATGPRDGRHAHPLRGTQTALARSFACPRSAAYSSLP